MPRKGENIYKRKDGRWEGRYIKSRSKDGKVCYGYIYGNSYLAVKEKMSLYPSHSSERQHSLCSNTFQFYAERWIEDSKIGFKESTQMKYRNLLNANILPYWKERTLDEINQAQYDSFCQELSSKGGKNGTGLSCKTILDITSVFKSILSYANEVENVECPNIRFRLKNNNTPYMRVFSIKEQEQMCSFLFANPSLSNIGILICMFTGIRIGELCALKWGDVMIDEDVIYVHQTMQRIQTNIDGIKTKIIISSPQSACSVRKIPIPNKLHPFLQHQYSPDSFVLTGSTVRFIEPRTMQNRFKSVLKQCAIVDANFHSLRHTFATRCIEAGIDVKTLSEILGHANVNITMNRYVHPSMEMKRESLNRLSELIAVK